MLLRRARLAISESDSQLAQVIVAAERPATDTRAARQPGSYFRRRIRKNATPTASNNRVTFIAR
jgi:hypothetical protein